MSNIATTISQSRKLIELGLDPNSADMVWTTANPDLPILLAYPIEDCNNWNDKIPAWSLSALLEVIPKETLPALEYREGNKEWEANVWIHHNIHCISHYDKMCAVYSMVCWLLEQGLIKKGGEDE